MIRNADPERQHSALTVINRNATKMDNATNGTLEVAAFHESDAMKYVISVMWPLALLEWLYCTYMVFPFLFSRKTRLPLGRFRLLVTCAYSSSSMSCWLTRFCMFLAIWTSQSEDGMFDMCPWLYFGALMVPEGGFLIVGNLDLVRVSRVMSQGRSLGARRGCGWNTLLVGTAIVVVCVYLRMVLGITDMMNLCQPDQIESPVAMEFAPPASEEIRAWYQSPFYFHTEWPAWLLETFVLFFTMPVTSA